MNIRQSPYETNSLNRGAIQIAGLYLLIGGLWILFSDQLAARVALSQEMLTTISLYKGWGYVLVTALLLYWLIKRHTAALHAYEVQLQRVIDAMPVFISYVGADRHYRFTNKTYKEWYDDKAEGKHIEEVLGKAAYRIVSKYIDKVLTGETVSYETEIPFQDKELFMAVQYIPDIAADGQVRGFFVMAQDRTEQKQAEEDRRLWADAFEGCAHGIAIGDPDTNRIVVCNPAFASMHKGRVEDIVGSGILSLYASSDHEQVRRSVEKADQIGHARYEAHMVRKDGSIFPVQMDVVSVLGDDGELLYRVATAQDITERKSIDEKLKASETKYRTLVEHLPAITYVSGPDQYMGVSYISPQIESLGFNSKTWLADPEFWFRQIHPEDRERVSSELQQFEASDKSFRADYRLRLPNGETRWFHDESIRVRDQAGKPILKQGFMLDITERKQAEEEIKSLARFPDENPNPILRVSYKGKIIYANASSEPLLGDWRSNVGGYLPADWIKLISELINTGARKTIDVQCKDTTYSIIIVPVPDANYVNLYGRDITERKQAEEYLRRFELLSEHSRDIILFIDRNDGRILEANAAAIQAYGYSRDELLALTIRDLRASNTQGLTADQMAQADAGGILFETIHQRKDGTAFPVEVSSQGSTISGVRSLISIVRDITERKQAETALLESSIQFRTLFEASPDAILLIDPHGNWLVLDCNTAACQMNGYTHDELIGQPIDILNSKPLPSGELDEYLAKIQREGILRYETLHRRKDGTEFPLEVSTSLISLGGRDVLLGIDRDITERKQAEEKLRKSEERYRYLFENNPHPMWIYDRKTLAFQDVNDAAIARYGYSRQEFLNMTITDIRPLEDMERLMNNLAQPRQPLEQSDGWRHRLKDGRLIPVEITSHTIEIDGHESALVIAQDVTERKRAEAAAFENEVRYHRVLDAMMEGCQIIDFNWRYVYVNEVLAEQGKRKPEELLHHTMMEVYPGIENTELFAVLQQCMEERAPTRMENQFVFPDDSIGWFELSIQPAQEGIFILSTDITDRKRAEEALQKAHDELELKVQERTAALSQTNSLLQAMLDYTPDQIYFKDTQSRFIRNSKSQANLLGLSDPSQVVGKTDFDYFPHAAKAYAEEQEVMRTGKPLIDFEERVIWPDGRETWVSTSKVPLPNPEGQIIGIFGISRDITERKRTAQAIQQLNNDLEKQAAQLQAANKELEAFSYSVSHDLRAPLRAIDGYTRILVEDYEANLDEEGKRVCGTISAEARRMGQLIDDLLAFSRLGRKEMYSSKIDMKALAVSVFNELTQEAERERIEFQIMKLPSVRGDSSLMRQVWTNLLSNAIKFTSRKERAVIEVGSKPGKDEFIYYVRDTGAGFDMEYAGKLFGVFQRLHSESEFDGTGVGLAIVQRIIRRHGGRVWAEGEVEKGATFYFALPRKEVSHE